MRTVKTVLLVLGVIGLGVLVSRIGAGPILETLRKLAWWQFGLVCLPYGIITIVDTLGWRFAFKRDRAPFLSLLGARVAGEAVNVVTGMGSVGGEAVKTWLMRPDVSYQESVPSVIIAKTTITVAQALFLLLGIVIAWTTLPIASQVLSGMLWLLLIETLAVAGFFGTQVAGLFGRAGRLLAWLGIVDDASSARKLDQSLRGYYRHEWGRLSLSVGFHLLGWLLNALEAVVMLWALGIPASVLTATVIEALGSGVRFATFLVPASLGALEAANAAAFAALGFGAGAGLAFSLVRRARQLVWIVVGVVVLLAMRTRAAARPPGSRRQRRATVRTDR